MAEREGGFIKLHRQVQSWPLWRSMTANQRMVWIEMLFCANWKDDAIWYGTQRIDVRRGQFAHSESTLAKRAGVSRKVVRTTIAKLIAEGAIRREVGHENGPAEGPGPHLTTIVNYERYQGVDTDEGPTEGQPRAKLGPAEGPPRALREEGEEGKKRKNKPSLASAPPPPESDSRFQPFVKSAFDVFAEVRGGVALDFDGHDGKRLKDFLSRQPKVTADEFSARWRKALGMARYPGCAKVAHLVERWNEFAGAGPVSAAPVTAVASDHSTFQGGRRVV